MEEPPDEPPVEEPPEEPVVEVADAAPDGPDAAEDPEGAEDPGAADVELLEEGEEAQPATRPAARSATPVISPRWVRADSVIQ